MAEILVIIASAPGSAEARRAVDLAHTFREGGRSIAVVLLQDAVLAALAHSPLAAASELRELLAAGVPIYAAELDLALRGFSSVHLAPGTAVADDSHLVGLMLADGTRTLGWF